MLYEFEVTELLARRMHYVVEAATQAEAETLAGAGETVEDGETLLQTLGVVERTDVQLIGLAPTPYEPAVRTIRLPLGVLIATDGRSGRLIEGLPRNGPSLAPQLDALESLILAHAVAGVDVASAAYCEGVETALDAIDNWGHLAEPPPSIDA